MAHRYEDPRDIEVIALLSACLAYGRVELFKPRIEQLAAKMGPSPHAFVRGLDVEGARALLAGFVYRFNLPADLAVLLLGMGRALREKGSLEALFAASLAGGEELSGALARFASALRDVPREPIRRALGRERGLAHLLPTGPGAKKRLNLFLRWMVRGPDRVDFGIWKCLSPARLVVPLDTHLHRVALRVGLTDRKSADWRTAEEITASLRRIDPEDPVRFDFALCHLGMSGECRPKPAQSACARCLLCPACPTGRGLTRAASGRPRR